MNQEPNVSTEAQLKAQQRIVSTDDPTVLVLKTHLLTETYMDRVITLYLSRGDKVIQQGNLTYEQKVTLVEAFDYVPDFLIQSLKNLNEVRNRCARDMDHAVTLSDVEYVGSPLGKYYTQIKREHRSDLIECLSHIFIIITAGWSGVIDNLETDELTGETQAPSKDAATKAMDTASSGT